MFLQNSVWSQLKVKWPIFFT